jgi:hypothetical protein
MMIYYHKLITNVSTTLHLLHHLVKKDTEFVWNTTCETTFQNKKSELVSAKVLVHYDPKLPIVLATDDDQSERPIALGSRKLTKNEAHYV